jgi:copper homeostasis protein
MPLIEICAYSLDSALAAEQAGANRIELCADPAVGGITPSAGNIEAAREHLRIPVMVMIRPRGGSFVYSDVEFEAMKSDIAFCRKLKVEGVVLGVLDDQNNIDHGRTAELVAAARPLNVTFHRAFDLTPDPIQALETVIAAGCTRVLTSGHRPTAVEGAADIAKLITAADRRIIIMPGSGVRSTKLADLARITGAHEFHSSARSVAATPTSAPPNTIAQGFGEAPQIDTSEVERLREAADALDHAQR